MIMIFKSETMTYVNSKKEYTPLQVLDTTEKSLKKFNAESEGYEEVEFKLFTDESGEDFICTLAKCHHACTHLKYSAENYPERLQKMLNDGTLAEYLIGIENSTEKAIDRQVDKWEHSDKEYLVAKELGDIRTQAGLTNNFIAMAKEVIYPSMIYR